MGKPVLTPEGNLLGKAFWLAGGSPFASSGATGEREVCPTFRRPLVGIRGCKAVNNGGPQGSLARGELSFLFDVADASNLISVGGRRLNT
jgi:hypothetical protein